MTTFNPSQAPSVSGTSKVITPRVRRAEFGDGYSQRGKDGLNYNRRSVTLTWNVLESDDADTIEAFFVALGGSDVFTYTLPLEATAYQWTNGPIKRGYVDGELVTLSVDLTQEFDL